MAIQRYEQTEFEGMIKDDSGSWCRSDDVAALEVERDAFRDELTRTIQQLNEASRGIGAIKAHAASNYMTLARERDALAADLQHAALELHAWRQLGASADAVKAEVARLRALLENNNG